MDINNQSLQIDIESSSLAVKNIFKINTLQREVLIFELENVVFDYSLKIKPT